MTLTSITELEGLLSNNSPSYAVRQFMEQKRGLRVGVPGVQPEYKQVSSAIDHLHEEISEVLAEIRKLLHTPDYAGTQTILAKLFKELADLQYVSHQLALVFGYDLDSVFNLVHWSNMTKDAAETAGARIGKGPSYQPPNIEAELNAQAGDYHYFGGIYESGRCDCGGGVEEVFDQAGNDAGAQPGGFTPRSQRSIQNFFARLLRR